jgi:hypothetical protein
VNWLVNHIADGIENIGFASLPLLQVSYSWPSG